MPITSSPWVSPSSATGRRLLLTEPATLDAIPVLDDAIFAALARAAARSSADSMTPRHRAPVHPAPVDRRASRLLVLGAAGIVAFVLGLTVPSIGERVGGEAGASSALPPVVAPVVATEEADPIAAPRTPRRAPDRSELPAARGPEVAGPPQAMRDSTGPPPASPTARRAVRFHP